MKIAKHWFLIAIFSSLILGTVAADILPLNFTRFFYSISITIKELISIYLPFFIFSCIAFSLLGNSKTNLGRFIFLIVFLCCSNAISTLISYGIFDAMQNFQQSNPQILNSGSDSLKLLPLWQISLPHIISNKWAFIWGLIAAVIISNTKYELPKNTLNLLYNFNINFLKKIFIPAIPFFIFGFVTQLSYEGKLSVLLSQSFHYFLIITLSITSYLLFLSWIAAICSSKPITTILYSIISPVVTSFGTMSSMAALPLSTKTCIEITGDKKFVNMFIPSSVNIHLIGDSIGVPILAMMLMSHFYGSPPSFEQYIIFIGYFVIAKFAIAAIPGGGIIAIIPVLENVFNFNTQMVSIITMLYLLFDPIFTASNVAGNNLMCIIFNKIISLIAKNKK